jgi:hypothetical protein
MNANGSVLDFDIFHLASLTLFFSVFSVLCDKDDSQKQKPVPDSSRHPGPV